MRLKIFPILLLTLTCSSCRNEPSIIDSLEYLDSIFSNIATVKKDISNFTKTRGIYLKAAFNQNNPDLPINQILELKSLNTKIIEDINKASDNINALPDIKLKIDMKSSSLLYLNRISKLHKDDITYMLNLLTSDSLSDSEFNRLNQIKASQNKMKTYEEEFNKDLIEFYNEAKINNKQLDSLFHKYSFFEL